MMLNQIVGMAASVYPDGYPLQYWDNEAQQPRDNPAGGDTLAQFIVQELADTYDPEADDCAQIAAAVKAMQTAADDLAAIVHALGFLARESAAA